MEKQNNCERTEGIDFTAMMISIVRSWRKILVGALAGAILLGGAFTLKGGMHSSTTEAAQQEYEQQLEEYNTAKEKHEQLISGYKDQLDLLESEQESVSAAFQNEHDYLEKSILMNLDPNQVCSASAVLYVNNGYQIQPGMDYQNVDNMASLLDAYTHILENSTTLSSVAEQVGMEELYLQELITVTADVDARSLSIDVISDSVEHSESILAAVLKAQQDAHETVAQSIGSHEVTEISNSSGVVVSTTLAETQKKFRADLAELEKNASDLRDKYNQATQNLTTEQQNLKALSAPTAPTQSGIRIKYFVLGALVGIIAVVVWVVVQFLIAAKVYSAEALRRCSGLSVLGSLTDGTKKQKKGISAWLNRLEGRSDGSNDNETIQMIAEMVRKLAPEAESVLLTGDLTDEQLLALQAKLQSTAGMSGKQVSTAGCVLKSASAVEQIASSDVILLVAACNQTRYENIRVQNEKIQQLGKKILGCIVLE